MPGRRISPTEDLRRRMALSRHRGNVVAAARELGLNRSSLYAFARRYKLGRKGQGINTKLPVKEIMRRVKAWHDFPTDRSASSSLNMKKETFTIWRVRHNLPGRNYKGRIL